MPGIPDIPGMPVILKILGIPGILEIPGIPWYCIAYHECAYSRTLILALLIKLYGRFHALVNQYLGIS